MASERDAGTYCCFYSTKYQQQPLYSKLMLNFIFTNISLRIEYCIHMASEGDAGTPRCCFYFTKQQQQPLSITTTVVYLSQLSLL